MNAGDKFNSRYTLKQSLGHGAFGEVWLAHDDVTDMDVAVKIYISLDDSGIKEFAEEYKNAYSLNHPNLLHAYHYDVADGTRPFLVMPFCPGKAVDLISKADENTLWKFIHDVSSGLAYLHEKNIIHRDIKPDNILREEDGDFLITDFGISTKMKNTLRRNSTMIMSSERSLAGTIGYMAPELFSGNPDHVKASDIWALGVSLFEMISGELPFFGNGGGMQLSGAQVPEVKGNFTDRLKKTIMACMAKDPWNRPSAKELADFAASVIAGSATSARWIKEEPLTGTSAPSVIGKKKGTNAAFIVFLTIGVILLAIFITFCISKANHENEASDSTQSIEITDPVQQTTVNPVGTGPNAEHEVRPIPEKNPATATESPKTAPSTENTKKEQTVDGRETRLNTAIKAGDWRTVKNLADSGYAAAYLPLARQYAKDPSMHEYADRYAKKAKYAGYNADDVFIKLKDAGFYD